MGEKSCLGIDDKISSVELFSVNYITVDQQQYNLLSLSYPEQSQFVLHENWLHTAQTSLEQNEGEAERTFPRVFSFSHLAFK